MKKAILYVCAYLFTFSIVAQNEAQNDHNELKINAIYTILRFPELSYSRILSEDSTIGISLGINVSPKDTDKKGIIPFNFLLIPYYRFFLGKKYASGFFVEANMGIYTPKCLKQSCESSNTNSDQAYNKLRVGLGFAVGGKLTSPSKKFVGEIRCGVGRDLTSNAKGSFYPAIAISIGRRF